MNMRLVSAFGFSTALIFIANAGFSGQLPLDGLDALPLAHPGLDVIVVGEVHDNPAHHENQARLVAAFSPKALVFEMLSETKAGNTPNGPRDQAALARAYGWDDSGWPDFAMYYPIFAAAPNARIYGAEVPRAEARAAVSDGASTVFGAQSGVWGLDQPLLPDDLAARMAEQADAHCGAFPTDLLPGMVEAQRLRDAYLARATAQALAETGPPVMVITGTGHARITNGMPALLRTGRPELKILSIGQLEQDPGPDAPFDLWLVTGAFDRPDPCAGLR